MKIVHYKKFILALILLALSFIPFSYVNYKNKIQLKNCEVIRGFVANTKKQEGKFSQIVINLKENKFEYQIPSSRYNALNEVLFEKFVNPGQEIEIYTLKPIYYGVFEKWDNSNNRKDALGLISSNQVILDNEKIRNSSNFAAINLISTLLFIGFGIKLLVGSLNKQRSNKS
jgi:hypothetical protein